MWKKKRHSTKITTKDGENKKKKKEKRKKYRQTQKPNIIWNKPMENKQNSNFSSMFWISLRINDCTALNRIYEQKEKWIQLVYVDKFIFKWL